MYNCKNIFDLGSYNYWHVRQATKALIHDIIETNFIISHSNSKIIHLDYDNHTLDLMKQLGIISNYQSLNLFRHAIGNYLFIRLVFAINIMKHIPKCYSVIFKKFSPNQRIKIAKSNHDLKMINIGNHFSGIAEGAIKSGFKSVALIHNNQNEVYNYIFNNPQINLNQNTRNISLMTNNLHTYNYITNLKLLNKYHPKAFIFKLKNNQDGFNLATHLKNQFNFKHIYNTDFHLFNSKYFNTFQNGMYLLLIGIHKSYQISAKDIINRVLAKHLHTSLPLADIFYQIPYFNNHSNVNDDFSRNIKKAIKIPINCSKKVGSHLYYQPNYEKPLPRTKLNQLIISPNQKRILNVRELATIQSYPVDYRFLSDILSSRREIINNLPPTISEAITNEFAKIITHNSAEHNLKQKETISS